MTRTYTLYIDAYTPETIPMARLALYMQSFAKMLGHEDVVHFRGLVPGSTQLAAEIAREHAPKIADRLDRIARGEAPPELEKVQAEIDDLLAGDDATGFVYADTDKDAKIIAFPGATRPKPMSYGPFTQDGTLDGVLVSIGGADKTVHLQLQNGELKYTGLETDRDMARRLATHLYEPIRVSGTGRWLREADGAWTLKRFRVRDFEPLKSTGLREAIDALRAIEGSDWTRFDDPIATLRALRDETDGLH